MDSRQVSEAIIDRIVEHNSDTRSLFLRFPNDQRLNFIPGQFLSLQLPVAGKILTRPYSIASNPEDRGPLEICFNLVPEGQGSHYLFSLGAGDSVTFTGPWGTFVLGQAPSAECIFLADGIGIVPIRPMIHRALKSHSQFAVRLLYHVAREYELLYRTELEAWTQQHVQFSLELLGGYTSDRLSTVQGSLLEYVEDQYVKRDEDRSRHFYICGVGSQVTQLRDLLRGAGYQRRAVVYEKW
ncbi:MAG: FAD-dependent oxidoreductase [Deltaproteobacteria bacterium]|nr:FAD-dependent oxidoreductase [Deltaproteobacteria bacterium]